MNQMARAAIAKEDKAAAKEAAKEAAREAKAVAKEVTKEEKPFRATFDMSKELHLMIKQMSSRYDIKMGELVEDAVSIHLAQMIKTRSNEYQYTIKPTVPIIFYDDEKDKLAIKYRT